MTETQHTDYQETILNEEIARVIGNLIDQRDVCPIKDVLARFADKWSVYVILLVGQHQYRRFNQLKSGIPGISQRMLTVTLRTLEEDGLMVRTQYAEIPMRVEYHLTGLGKGLLSKVVGLASWAHEHHLEIVNSRLKYGKKMS